MEQSDEKAIRSALQFELAHLKKLGFFVVEEAFRCRADVGFGRMWQPSID